MIKRVSGVRARLFAVLSGTMLVAAVTTRFVFAADHVDSPLVTGDAAADIADVYSFVSPANADNLVLAMTLHGFVPPTENAISLFDPSVLYQFKIDSDGDAIEDLVVQAFVTGGPNNQVMHVRGPVAPEVIGSLGRIVNGGETMSVRVSTGTEPIVASRQGMTVFAGVRDDPFFLDLGQFMAIVGGQATAFNNPGTDAFAGFNAYAIVIELPIAALGGSPDLRVWGTTSR